MQKYFNLYPKISLVKLTIISILGYCIYSLGGVSLFTLFFFPIPALYGLYSLKKGNLCNWLSVVSFFAGCESIIKNGLPFGFLFFYYYLIISLLIDLSNNKTLLKYNNRLIFIAWFLLLIMILLYPGGDYFFGIKLYFILYFGVMCGMLIASRIKIAYILDLCLCFLCGSLSVLLCYLFDNVYIDGRYWPRFDGTGPMAVIAGLAFLVSFLSLYLINSKRDKYILFIIMILSLLSLILTASRGSIIALALSLFFSAFFLMKFSLKNIIIFCFISIVLFFVSISFDDYFGGGLNARFEDEFNDLSEGNSREGRIFIAKAVLESFKEQPFIGNGTGGWKLFQKKYLELFGVNNTYTDTHNVYLQFIFEYGLFGLFLFLIILIFLFRRSFTLFSLSKIPLFSILIYFVVTCFTTFPNKAPLWFIFLLSILSFSKNPSNYDTAKL